MRYQPPSEWRWERIAALALTIAFLVMYVVALLYAPGGPS